MTYTYNDGISRKPHERWALRQSRMLTSGWCLFVQFSLECQQAQSVCCQGKISRGYCHQCWWGTWGITLEVDTNRPTEMRRGGGSIPETWFSGLSTVSQSAYIFAAVRPAPIRTSSLLEPECTPLMNRPYSNETAASSLGPWRGDSWLATD